MSSVVLGNPIVRDGWSVYLLVGLVLVLLDVSWWTWVIAVMGALGWLTLVWDIRVEGAADTVGAAVYDVGVDHGGGDALVA